MYLPIDIATSLEFWRRVYSLQRSPKGPVCLPPGEIAIQESDIRRLAPSWATPRFLEKNDGILHTMCRTATQRRRSAGRAIHLYTELPAIPSFYRFNDHVYIASPEYVFLVAATMLDFPQLIALGDELCGMYSFDPEAERGFRTREVPLVGKMELDYFIADCHGLPGSVQARRALTHVVEKSASPMETVLEQLICLPQRLGGYNLPQPDMNLTIPLSQEAARIAKREKCLADLCYLDAHIDIEYSGELDHSPLANMHSDFARINALRKEGFEVIVVTKQQLDDLIAFETIVQGVARKLNKRIRRKHLGNLPQRKELRRKLFAWNVSGGRVR